MSRELGKEQKDAIPTLVPGKDLLTVLEHKANNDGGKRRAQLSCARFKAKSMIDNLPEN